jgi:lipopolysaccharide transport system ATP-binding protein
MALPAVKPIIRFDNVAKRFTLRTGRLRTLRAVFVRRRLHVDPVVNPHTLWALRDVSFEIQPGETVALIGTNGAGKSTTLKLISRIISPTSGTVAVNGRVAALLELGTGFHGELSGRDNVYLAGSLAGMGRAEIDAKFDAIVAFAELERFIDAPLKHYSSGMYARLGFAVSIHLEPQVLLVDEVLAVGDQSFQLKCLERIGEMQREGVTILAVSHDLRTVRKLARRVLWFEAGRLVADGTTDVVATQYLDHVTDLRLAGGAAGPEAGAIKRFGSGRVRLRAVRLTDARGERCVDFQTGDTLVAHLDYEAPQPVPAPVFGVSIHRSDGVQVCAPTTQSAGVSMADVHGAGTLTYTIPALPLLDGVYELTALAQDTTGLEVYDYHDRAYPFRVRNPGGALDDRFGLLSVQGQWDLRVEALQPQ